MGTKRKPGKFDCYQHADQDEPMFVLLARDADAPDRVREWCRRRLRKLHQVSCALSGRPDFEEFLEEVRKVAEAMDCVDAMEAWRKEHRDEVVEE